MINRIDHYYYLLTIYNFPYIIRKVILTCTDKRKKTGKIEIITCLDSINYVPNVAYQVFYVNNFI